MLCVPFNRGPHFKQTACVSPNAYGHYRRKGLERMLDGQFWLSAHARPCCHVIGRAVDRTHFVHRVCGRACPIEKTQRKNVTRIYGKHHITPKLVITRLFNKQQRLFNHVFFHLLGRISCLVNIYMNMCQEDIFKLTMVLCENEIKWSEFRPKLRAKNLLPF